jgi:carboxyl-terminal processing protease
MTMFRLFDPDATSAFLLAASIRAALALAAAGAVALALRRASAAARHFVWGLGLAGALAVPALSPALPAWRVSWPRGWVGAGSAVASEGLPDGPRDEAPIAIAFGRPEPALPGEVLARASGALPARDRAADESATASARQSRPLALSAWVLGAWAAGAALTAVPTCLGLLSLRRLGRSARRVNGGPASDLLKELSDQFGLKRRVRLVRADNRTMPMTWGIVRPVILLPADAYAWPEARLRVVLAHELAHVKRWDCLTRLLARSVRALYWFNPLAWLAEARVRAEQERACDDLALGGGGVAPWEYAEHLLVVTSAVPAGWTGPAVALAMAAPSRIEHRLRTILDAGRDRRPTSRRQACFATLAALALAVPLSAGRLRAEAQAAPPDATAKGEDKARPQDGQPAAGDETALLEQVRQSYVRPPDESTLVQGAIQGMIAALNDPYSEYIAPEKFAGLQKQIEGKLTGIGVQLEMKDDRVTIIAPLEGSPAFKAGVGPGDAVLEIDGKPTAGIDLTEAVRRIAGPSGTVVRLKVRHADGQEADLAIQRGPIELRSVLGARRANDRRWDFMLDPGHKIGYARLTQLAPATPKDLSDAIRALQAEGVKGMILDLRACPGGMLDSAVQVASLFLPKGKVVTVRGRDNEDRAFEADGKSTLGDFPMVVLANEQTASAAEILTGALKENGRAVVVGTRTFGKGSVQTLIAVKGGGAVKLTTAFFYTPGGRGIDKRAGAASWGVDPTDGDYVPMSAEQTAALLRRRRDQELAAPQPRGDQAVTPEQIEKEQGDPQLAAALRALIAKTTTGEFAKVGGALPDLAARAARPEDVRKRRASLLKDLEKIKKELDELNRVTP